MMWQTEISQDRLTKYIFFLISPLLGFLYSLKRINSKSSFVVFFLFSVFFGLCFTTSDGKDEAHRGDAAAYRQKFEYQKYFYSGDISDIYAEFITFANEDQRDIYIPVMSFATSRVSESYHIFFMFLAAVFSCFLLLSLKQFVQEPAYQYTLPCLLLLLFFIFNNGIYNINGCRFWTASWVAIYSIFQIFKNGKKKYIILAAITPLIHASYWFFLGVLCLAHFTGRRTHLWKVLFFLSFFVSSVAIQLVVDLSDYLPASLQFLVDRYTEGEIEEKTNLYQLIRRFFDFAFTVYLTVIIYRFMQYEDEIKQNRGHYALYCFLLVWMSIVNFVMPIPSLGVRYRILSYPFIAYLWLVTFESKGLYRNYLKWFPVVTLFFIYERFTGYTQGSVPLDFYYMSPIYQFYKYIIVGVI